MRKSIPEPGTLYFKKRIARANRWRRAAHRRLQGAHDRWTKEGRMQLFFEALGPLP